jgi:hypothetical protein
MWAKVARMDSSQTGRTLSKQIPAPFMTGIENKQMLDGPRYKIPSTDMIEMPQHVLQPVTRRGVSTEPERTDAAMDIYVADTSRKSHPRVTRKK